MPPPSRSSLQFENTLPRGRDEVIANTAPPHTSAGLCGEVTCPSLAHYSPPPGRLPFTGSGNIARSNLGLHCSG